MASKGNDVSEQTIGQRVLDVLERLETAYKGAEETVRGVTPRVSRTLEVILAIGLFVGLSYWAYVFLVV